MGYVKYGYRAIKCVPLLHTHTHAHIYIHTHERILETSVAVVAMLLIAIVVLNLPMLLTQKIPPTFHEPCSNLLHSNGDQMSADPHQNFYCSKLSLQHLLQ